MVLSAREGNVLVADLSLMSGVGHHKKRHFAQTIPSAMQDGESVDLRSGRHGGKPKVYCFLIWCALSSHSDKESSSSNGRILTRRRQDPVITLFEKVE